MISFHDVLKEVLERLRGSRVAAFLPCQNPAPAAPAPILPRPPRLPQKMPIRLPPLPPQMPPPLPMPVPAASERYPRQQTSWGLDGGWAPTTSGYETRVYDPPSTLPKTQPAALPFSIFDDLWDE